MRSRRLSSGGRPAAVSIPCALCLMVTFASLAIAARATAQCGGQGAGSCCTAGNAPYCNDLECCQSVCGLDPYCCDEANGGTWDPHCADLAWEYCPTLPGCSHCAPQAGTCCFANDSPGCSNASCCHKVCDIRPKCCDERGPGWDSTCVSLAMEHCGFLCACAGGAGNCCAASGSPFCNNGDCCNAVCQADAYCCEVEWDDCCAHRATQHCHELPGCLWPPQPQPACAEGTGDCCTGHNGLGCSDMLCCETICALDPFCCEVRWDALCAAQAMQHCGGGCTGAANAPPAFSCIGNCGGAAISGCWCDEDCCAQFDCCPDKLAECGGCDPGSCEGICGLPDDACWCDEVCCDVMDCCPDKYAQCGGCNPNW